MYNEHFPSLNLCHFLSSDIKIYFPRFKDFFILFIRTYSLVLSKTKKVMFLNSDSITSLSERYLPELGKRTGVDCRIRICTSRIRIQAVVRIYLCDSSWLHKIQPFCFSNIDAQKETSEQFRDCFQTFVCCSLFPGQQSPMRMRILSLVVIKSESVDKAQDFCKKLNSF